MWTEDQTSQCVDMYTDGASVNDIADAMARSRKSVYGKLAREGRIGRVIYASSPPDHIPFRYNRRPITSAEANQNDDGMRAICIQGTKREADQRITAGYPVDPETYLRVSLLADRA